MDDYGRYTLGEMYMAVRRRVDMVRKVVDVKTGKESETLQLNPLVSDEDIKLYLNTALFKRTIDIAVLDNTILSDSSRIDLVKDQVEYILPADLMFLRSVYYKPPSVTFTEVPPNQRIYLYEYDQEGDIGFDLIGTPTYRRRLNKIVLNDVPKEDNHGGLVVEYVKGPFPLRVEDQVLETPLAFFIQEVIILDAAIYITSERMKMDASELRVSLKELEARLSLAAVNYHAPKTIRMVNPIQMARLPNRRVGWAGRRG
jgi:hypothetical protein